MRIENEKKKKKLVFLDGKEVMGMGIKNNKKLYLSLLIFNFLPCFLSLTTQVVACCCLPFCISFFTFNTCCCWLLLSSSKLQKPKPHSSTF